MSIKVATTLAAACGAIGVLAQWLTPVAHTCFEMSGVRPHAARAGNGPLVAFLHGVPEFRYKRKSQVRVSGRDHAAVAPDLRVFLAQR